MNELLKLFLLSLGSVVFLFIISKLSGKKQIAQLEFIDYVMGISIGSIAAEMATDLNETPFYHYLIAMGVFFLFDYLVSVLGRKGSFFKRFFKGKPITIIYEGKIRYKELKRSKLDVNEVLALAREKGYFDLSQVDYAIFENSGNLSIMPKPEQKPTVVADFNISPSQNSLSNYLIIDGNISYSTLNQLGKTENWLYKRLKIKTKRDLKKLILVQYVKDQDKFVVHKK
mgnify:CR=1 FL=1